MRFFEEVLTLDAEWKSSRYASVQRWISVLARRGSVSTMRAYFKLLAWFVQFSKVSPDEFVKLPKNEICEKVQGFCDKFSSEGKRSTALNAMKALRSFLKANKFRLEEFDFDASYRVMKRPEYVPTKEEVYKMASACDLKWSAIILCLFQSGLRNSTLRALTYSMVESQLENGEMPIKVHITRDLRKILPDACKEDVDYWTFFGPQAVEALKRYTAWRKEKYLKIEEDELLFPSESRSMVKNDRTRKPMDQWHLTRIVKKAARKAGIKDWHNIRAHSLRKTFRAILDAGYVDGGQMAEDDKEYLMGHKLPGSKAPYHNANITDLAQRYTKLNWAPASQISKESKIELIKTFAKSLGITELELRIQKLRKVQPELEEMDAIGKVMREELGIKPQETKMVERSKENESPDCGNENCRRFETRIVSEDELLLYLDKGWDIIKELRNTKIVIRRNTTANDSPKNYFSARERHKEDG